MLQCRPMLHGLVDSIAPAFKRERSWLRWLNTGLLFICASLTGTGPVSAQALDPTRFCYIPQSTTTAICSDTLQDAESTMRADPYLQSVASYLERMELDTSVATTNRNSPQASFYYQAKNRAPATQYTMYAAQLSTAAGNGGFGCAPVAQDPNAPYTDWCDSEASLLATAQQRLQATDLSGCRITGTTLTVDNAAQQGGLIERDSGNPVRGLVRLGQGYDVSYRTYRTDASCPNSTPVEQSITWRVKRHTTFLCVNGYLPNQTYLSSANGLWCVPSNNTIATILGPLKQCASCAGSPNPIYPATGEKARQEPDFDFAGRTFTRYYHSLGQFRTNPAFALNWTHTYSDRVSGITGFPTVGVVDDQGYFESYTDIGGGRYRGENSTDRVIDAVNDGAVVWRLRMPDGELREFDTNGRLIGIRNPNRPQQDVVLSYTNGLLSAVSDAQGRQLKFEYANNLLTRIVKPDGVAVNYGYDADLNLTTVNYGNGIRTYLYHETGLVDPKFVHQLTGIVGEDNMRFASFAYDTKGRVTSSTVHGTPNEVTTATYPSDTQTTILTANGATRQYTLDTGLYRHVTGTSDPAGTTSASYDATTGQMTSRTDQRSIVTKYEYAAGSGYRSATVEAFGNPEQRRQETTRDPVSNLVTERRTFDASGVLKAKITWTYNARNQVQAVKATDPSITPNPTRITTYSYCEQSDMTANTCPYIGLLKSIDGPSTDINNIDVTTYTYYMNDPPGCIPGITRCYFRKGDLATVTNALGQAMAIAEYDDAGRAISVNDTNGIKSEFEYDIRGRITARKLRGADDAIETDDQITRIEYWPSGMVKKVTQPDGTFTSHVYDGAYRLTAVADNAGNSVTYTLSAAGDRKKDEIKDSSGVLQQTLSRTYNTLGQLETVQTKHPDAAILTPVITSFTYDLSGNPDQITDGLTRIADSNYDPLGRLSRSLQDMAGIAAETRYSYDVLDNLVKVNDPKLLDTNYTYNGFSELLLLSSPDTGNTTYTYDSVGNLKTLKDARNKTATYAYDALNRLKSVTYPTTSLNTAFTYDVTQAACATGETFSVGRLTSIADESGTTVYCYDRFGQRVRKVQNTNGKTFILRYVYETSGRLQKIIYPDLVEVTYVYDTQGRAKQVDVKTASGSAVPLLRDATYYPFGPVAQWTYGSGTNARNMQRSLNQNYQPGYVQVTASGGIDIGYEFDEVGNLKKLRAANQSNPPKRLFGYDRLNRLNETRDGSTNAVLQGYAYDKTGNRTSATIGAVTTAYTYPTTNHRLSSTGATARTYDANGNTLTVGATKTHVYNDLNRMSQVKSGTTTLMNYLYNGRGEQVRKYIGTTNTYSLYDEMGRWLGDYDNAGTPTQQVIWLNDLPVGVLVGATAAQKLHYIEPDALGTPRVVVDPTRGTNGTAVWTWDLVGEAFGTTAPNQNPDGDATQFVFNMRFAGQRYDSVSGMNYNMQRDYEAATGRYIESDPIGLNGGFATYDYAENRPNISIDRLGLSPESGVGVFNTPNSCELCAPDKKRFNSRTEAARTILAGIYLKSRDKNIEVCGQICRDNKTGKFFIGGPTLGTGTTCNPWDKECPACSTSAAFWHTHGAPDGPYSEQFSYGRRSDVEATNWAAGITGDPSYMGFLGTPSGFLITYTANSTIGPINQGRLK
jgi:RHS repeat-associated protein